MKVVMPDVLKNALTGFIGSARFTGVAAGLCLLGIAGQALAQAGGIYTCVDSKGRKLTSDRPIAECVDREQKVLNPSGTVKGQLGPTLTAQERVEEEAKAKLVQEETARRDEEKRRDRALLSRYPNKGVHDAERAEALKQVGAVKAAAALRVEELNSQGAVLKTEMEFYKKDPTKAPAYLLRQVDEVNQSLAVQARFIADQNSEITRVNARFNDELVRLKQLWALKGPAVAPVAAASKAK
jgi:hypothetical protein